MWGMEQDDWSLQAIVNECTKKFQPITTLKEKNVLIIPTSTTPITTTSPTVFDVESYPKTFPLEQSGKNSNSSDFLCVLHVGSNDVGDIIYETGSSSSPIIRSPDNNNTKDIATKIMVEDGETRDKQHPEKQDPKRRRDFLYRKEFIYTVDELAANDKWAWRKYGQKSIKGSPHPRSYYKCSTLKTCEAKKLVDPHPDDPNTTYIITYCGEHNHPYPTPRTFEQNVKSSYPDIDYPAKEYSPSNIIPPQICSESSIGFGPVYDSWLVGDGENIDNKAFYDGDVDIVEESNLNVDKMVQSLVGDPNILTGYDSTENVDGNVYNYGYEMNDGSNPNMNMSKVQVNGANNGFGFNNNYNNVGIKNGMYSAPTTRYAPVHETPNNMSNMWVDGMIG